MLRRDSQRSATNLCCSGHLQQCRPEEFVLNEISIAIWCSDWACCRQRCPRFRGGTPSCVCCYGGGCSLWARLVATPGGEAVEALWIASLVSGYCSSLVLVPDGLESPFPFRVFAGVPRLSSVLPRPLKGGWPSNWPVPRVMTHPEGNPNPPARNRVESRQRGGATPMTRILIVALSAAALATYALTIASPATCSHCVATFCGDSSGCPYEGCACVITNGSTGHCADVR